MESTTCGKEWKVKRTKKKLWIRQLFEKQISVIFRSRRAGGTLFIFSNTQGFPSEYPKLVSESPEQRLRKPLLKRQAFFDMSSVSSCRKYSPGGQSSFLSCCESLYPLRREDQRYIEVNGMIGEEWSGNGFYSINLSIRFIINVFAYRQKVHLLCRKDSRCLTYCTYFKGSDLLNDKSREFGRITNPATKAWSKQTE